MNRLEAIAIRHPLRVQLLDALVDGKTLDLASYAKALDLSPPLVAYHCQALADAGAVEVREGKAKITERGKDLHQLAQIPNRRRKPDRRRGNRRDRRQD